VSFQRRRGETARIWKMVLTTDTRGNEVYVADPTSPHEVRAAFIPQRSSRAEVPGQQQINVIRMIVDHSLADVGLWSRVEYQGREWDVVTPPSYHHGTRRTRHWSIDLRERP
jgi:hypothetical protein